MNENQVFEAVYFPTTTDIGDWTLKNYRLLEMKYGVKGYHSDRFFRGKFYTITHIQGQLFRGSVSTDHLGRNPDDEDVMIVERFLEHIRFLEHNKN